MKKRRRRMRQPTATREVSGIKAHEIPQMRAAGRFAAELLDAIEPVISAGMTTAEIDEMVAELTRQRGATSAPLGYHGFPKHCCTSVNDVVCHGIPSTAVELRDGDIVNVDVTPIVDGYHGDASRTFFVGEVSEIAARLVRDTYQSLWRGIAAVRPGARVGDIGHAIQSFVEPRGYSVVQQFSGHGIGRIFHTAPAVMHFGRAGDGEELLPGMAFTIEPMINLGDWRCRILDDGWTAVTVDRALSAQFEHTVMVSASGVEVFTTGAHEMERLRDCGIEVPAHVRSSALVAAGAAGDGRAAATAAL